MAGRRELSIESRKGVYTKEWGAKSKNNSVTSWCTSGRT